MSKIKHILSVIHYITHYTICGAVCFQFTHSPCDDWENIYTLSYYHHQIGSMNYSPLFRVRSLNNGVDCMSFYIFWTIPKLMQLLTLWILHSKLLEDRLWDDPRGLHDESFWEKPDSLSDMNGDISSTLFESVSTWRNSQLNNTTRLKL